MEAEAGPNPSASAGAECVGKRARCAGLRLTERVVWRASLDAEVSVIASRGFEKATIAYRAPGVRRASFSRLLQDTALLFDAHR